APLGSGGGRGVVRTRRTSLGEGRMTLRGWLRTRRTRRGWWTATGTIAIAIVAVLMIGTTSAVGSARGASKTGKENWTHLGTTFAVAHAGAKREILATKAQAYSLDRAGIADLLRA